MSIATPNPIARWFGVIMELTRCGRWSVKLGGFGRDSYIYPHVVIYGAENVKLGERVSIGEFTHVWGNAGISIGDDTLIAAGCQITTLSHDEGAKIYRDTLRSAPISIEANVWLGYGVRVMPGVTIGANSIIGAGSVVTRNIPPNVVAVGSPAKVIRVLAQHSLARTERN